MTTSWIRRSRPQALSQAASLAGYIWSHPSNQGRRLRSLGRAASWQIYKRLTGGCWDISLVEGRMIRCHPNSTSASSVLYAGLFDFDEMHFMLRYLRPEDNFIDIGANVGVYTILASSVITLGEIHAFEPSTPAHLQLEENVRLNGLTNVWIHAVAVADRPGQVWLTQGKETMNHLVWEGMSHDVENVHVVRLDDCVSSIGFAMGKMDIEGAELHALRGASSMLAAHNPPVWLLEINDACTRFGHGRNDLVGFLIAQGYHLASYEAPTNRFVLHDELPEGLQNVFAVALSRATEIETRLNATRLPRQTVELR